MNLSSTFLKHYSISVVCVIAFLLFGVLGATKPYSESRAAIPTRPVATTSFADGDSSVFESEPINLYTAVFPRSRPDQSSWERAFSSQEQKDLISILESIPDRGRGVSLRYSQAMLQGYEANGYQPIWFKMGFLGFYRQNDALGALLIAMSNAPQHGINPEMDLSQLIPDSLWTQSNISDADIMLTFRFLEYARLMKEGQVNPVKLENENYFSVEEANLGEILVGLTRAPDPMLYITNLQPVHPQYSLLMHAINTYEQLVDAGGWSRVEGIQLLKKGEYSGRVSTLRKRLIESGDLTPIPAFSDSLYDEPLSAAVAQFQMRHGLKPDSIVGPSTLAAMNVSASDRLTQMRNTLERLRWLPNEMGERYVLVNIPEFKVYGFDRGQKVLEMRVVVGAPTEGRNTPIFHDEIDHVAFRPYWNIPYGIAAEEVLPKALKDNDYMRRNGYQFVDNQGIEAPLHSIDLEDHPLNEYRIRQKPGPSNALGLVKYMFPNRHAIYLHDTPADHLFGLAKRALSHGCIRLENPSRFGAYILGKQGWSESDVDAAMHQGERRRVDLETPVPVYIVYHSAVVNQDGTLSFFHDIYGYDEIFSATLNSELR